MQATCPDFFNNPYSTHAISLSPWEWKPLDALTRGWGRVPQPPYWSQHYRSLGHITWQLDFGEQLTETFPVLCSVFDCCVLGRCVLIFLQQVIPMVRDVEKQL